MPAGIILTSHGKLAKEVLASAEMIIGQTENIQAVCMTMDDGSAGLRKKMEQAVDQFSDREGVLIITDLLGGTPCNVATLLAQGSDRITVMTGLNLAMVVEASAVAQQPLQPLTDYLVRIGKDSINRINPCGGTANSGISDGYDE
ncbi:PTS sugar transporter subunit IIA [Sporolactobacillus vineae]|uniref:PTS sugar transporter subunit IIA n=1 Tax=Sporolactobacillus vineae TaxID=444463 RepID=UPI0002884A7B|nr:PTS sugar transporter subunit IIA [Sporolactobacillus vineae]